METKEELVAKIRAIEKKEDQETQKAHFPLIKKKFEGKYFKYRNRFSSNQSWWLYYKVLEITKRSVFNTSTGVEAVALVYSFETDSNKEIRICPEKEAYVSHLGAPISKKEFMSAHKKMMKSMKLK